VTGSTGAKACAVAMEMPCVIRVIRFCLIFRAVMGFSGRAAVMIEAALYDFAALFETRFDHEQGTGRTIPESEGHIGRA
jgi:hypothetical protein